MIAEGHVKMTLGSDIWFKRAVTLKAISIVNRKRRREDQKEPRGDHCTHAPQVRNAASFLRKIRLLPEKGQSLGERSNRLPEVGGFVFLSWPRFWFQRTFSDLTTESKPV